MASFEQFIQDKFGMSTQDLAAVKSEMYVTNLMVAYDAGYRTAQEETGD
jgi:hypothetical protein